MTDVSKLNEREIIKMFNIEHREPFGVFLFGSANYNLMRNADKDYKVFVLPTLKDLYFGHRAKADYVSEDLDYSMKDVRFIPQLIYKSNINWLEIFFSSEQWVNPKYQEFWDKLMAKRNEIIRLNIPYLYNACLGNIHAKLKRYNANGVTKEFHHAYRLALFIRDFANTNFSDFQSAIWYEDDSDDKKVLMSLKERETISKEEYDKYHAEIFAILDEYKELYFNHEVNEQLNEEIISDVYDIVRFHIKDTV